MPRLPVKRCSTARESSGRFSEERIERPEKDVHKLLLEATEPEDAGDICQDILAASTGCYELVYLNQYEISI